MAKAPKHMPPAQQRVQPDPLPPVAEPPSVVIRTAMAEAQAAIRTLRGAATLPGDDGEAAKIFLNEIAKDASQQIPPPPGPTPPPPPPRR